jgi:uncharacterized membrane protein YeaQ/YmgE (transglycosylase-associated protein family)
VPVIGLIIVGLIVGSIAKLVMPGRDPGGLIITIGLGIAGSIVAAAIGRGLGFYRPDQPAGWIMSVIGAVILLALYRVTLGRAAARRQ